MEEKGKSLIDEMELEKCKVSKIPYERYTHTHIDGPHAYRY